MDQMSVSSVFPIMRNIILFLITVFAIKAQPALPETPAGKTLAKWLEVFNGGERAQMKQFLETYNPERLSGLDGAVDFRKNTGGFHLFRVDKSEPREIEAIVREREGEGNYAKLTMKVADGDPARITALGIRVTEPPADAPVSARLGGEEAVAGWQAEIAKQVAAENFSGAYLWAKNGKVIASGAAGLADREEKVSNTLETKFRIGSMNKMFTSVATLQLVEKGKLALDEPVIRYLPDYPNRELASKVKIRHLLTHTGGTGDIFGPEFDKHRLELRTLNDYVNLYGKRGLAFEPGAKSEYSNYGFLLLGVLIEKVSGQGYYDYVRDHIFRLAGMTNTDSLPEGDGVAKRSIGYMKGKGQWAPNTDTLPWRGTSAGGGYSTVGDLMKFAQALTSHKLIGAALLAEATKTQVKESGYGFGFGTSNRGGMRAFGHGGGAPGMNGELQIFPDSGQVVVVLSNLDPPSASKVSGWLTSRMPKE